MMGLVLFIMIVFVFGGLMEKIGLIFVLLEGVMKGICLKGQLIVVIVCLSIGINLVIGEQYFFILILG